LLLNVLELLMAIRRRPAGQPLAIRLGREFLPPQQAGDGVGESLMIL
jgi:hypothetical protein